MSLHAKPKSKRSVVAQLAALGFGLVLPIVGVVALGAWVVQLPPRPVEPCGTGQVHVGEGCFSGPGHLINDANRILNDASTTITNGR